MLTKCPECELPVSDKAITCPHCGLPLAKQTLVVKNMNKRMRLPNGFGQITEIKDIRLRNKFRVLVTVGKTDTGKPVCKPLKPNAYFKTYNDAYMALVEYNKNPYDFDKAMILTELYESWSNEYFKTLNSDSSKRTIKSAWNKSTALYNMNVRDIRARHIKGVMDTVESENIRNRVKSMFNLMFDYAVENEIVEKNYARDFTTEDASVKNPHSSFTTEELTLLWNTKEYLSKIILIQCYMGWRPQEICLIRTEDVNINDWTIVGGIKTDAGRNRQVPICDKIRNIIIEVLKLAKKEHSDTLFQIDGNPVSYDAYYKMFKKFTNSLNMNHKPHDPRKTFATMCKNSKVDEYAIKYMIGHAITDLTEKVYTEREFNWLAEECKKINNYV